MRKTENWHIKDSILKTSRRREVVKTGGTQIESQIW